MTTNDLRDKNYESMLLYHSKCKTKTVLDFESLLKNTTHSFMSSFTDAQVRTDPEYLEMLTLLRINRKFMEHMRKYYNHKSVLQPQVQGRVQDDRRQAAAADRRRRALDAVVLQLHTARHVGDADVDRRHRAAPRGGGQRRGRAIGNGRSSDPLPSLCVESRWRQACLP